MERFTPGSRSYSFTGDTLILLSLLIFFSFHPKAAFSQSDPPLLHYTVSFPDPASHTCHIELHGEGWNQDTITLKMPNWMPGYYQIMDYAKSVENISALDENGKNIPLEKLNHNTWIIYGINNRSFTVSYTIRTNRQFVANSYMDSAHAYIIPENTFLYVDGSLQVPVSVKIVIYPEWENIATGLEPVAGQSDEFSASDFDILYDCPILIGNLEELPPFYVYGIEHRFTGYKIGDFDRRLFMENLRKVVQAAVNIIGEIPYQQYTFIGIGPGRGGIEHLNNTTISFNGNGLDSPDAMNSTMNFMGHEYFHHYNVKRIRPFELGPFDYENGNRTNLLWVSEGLSVYYEYLIVKRAGLADASRLFANFESNLNAFENDPGRFYQSLSQASYNTWEEGPFGVRGGEADRSISYYDKGPLLGLILDFEIRHATNNMKSLDDVMRMLYREYYLEKQRGFTDAEFQRACEGVTGKALNDLFEYVYTTKELDYPKYLAYAGLKVEKQIIDTNDNTGNQKLVISRVENPDSLQSAILNSWLGE
jgi:predicted metalloprotease with PDZ domain